MLELQMPLPLPMPMPMPLLLRRRKISSSRIASRFMDGRRDYLGALMHRLLFRTEIESFPGTNPTNSYVG